MRWEVRNKPSLFCFLISSFVFRHREGRNLGVDFDVDRYNMSNSRPLSLQTVELKVRMCCEGCERKNAVYKLRGVDSVELNLDLEKATVVGYVDRNKILKDIRRSSKRVEFWPYLNPPLYFTSANNYFKDTTHEFKESYNYYRHGYHLGDKHGNIPVTHRGDDQISNLFNDNNVKACCVM